MLTVYIYIYIVLVISKFNSNYNIIVILIIRLHYILLMCVINIVVGFGGDVEDPASLLLNQ